jgi:hypothetical protein
VNFSIFLGAALDDATDVVTGTDGLELDDATDDVVTGTDGLELVDATDDVVTGTEETDGDAEELGITLEAILVGCVGVTLLGTDNGDVTTFKAGVEVIVSLLGVLVDDIGPGAFPLEGAVEIYDGGEAVYDADTDDDLEDEPDDVDPDDADLEVDTDDTELEYERPVVDDTGVSVMTDVTAVVSKGGEYTTGEFTNLRYILGFSTTIPKSLSIFFLPRTASLASVVRSRI